MRDDKDLQRVKEHFVLLRMTYLRGVDLNLFAYDYDQTWMAFFLDADGRTYARYGSRDADSAESCNSVAGLRFTMEEVLRVHKEETAKEDREPFQLPPARRPENIPALKDLGYAGSCVRCHMVNEALLAQKRKDGKFERGDFWLYPPPQNVGLTLDRTEGNKVAAVKEGSFAAKAGLKAGDHLRTANGSRVLSRADLEFVLNGLAPKSQLKIEAERDGKPVAATFDLDGDWRRWDTSWRKSVWITSWRTPFVRELRWVSKQTRDKNKIPEDEIAYRFNEVKGALKEAGFQENDIVVAFDGLRKVPYKRPECYIYLEHKNGDKMEVTVLRDGKEVKVTYIVP